MSALQHRTDAILYLLDVMIGIDKHLDLKESALFIQIAKEMLDNDFSAIQEKITNITRLSREHDRATLLEEACDTLRRSSETIEQDLDLLSKMAAADRRIDPREQQIFDEICENLGVATRPLSV